MQNLYDEIRASLQYNKFQIGELLFAEYTCPIPEENVGIWAQCDYMVHVLSGKKTWHTTDGTWVGESGQTLFFKKGAAIIEQSFDEDFCLMVFFIPDSFVRDILKEMDGRSVKSPGTVTNPRCTAIRVQNDIALSAYFQSMLVYFAQARKPSETLLRLKLKELIINILSSSRNSALASYFCFLGKCKAPSVAEIMEANFRYNLSLEEFARMCHRSLSSFKRDFNRIYKETPGKWLLGKRLEYAAVQLCNTNTPVTQIVFDCGFEDLSHFSKAFKDKFGVSPTKFRDSAGENPGLASSTNKLVFSTKT